MAGPFLSIQEFNTLVVKDNSEDAEDPTPISKTPSPSIVALLPNLPALPESSASEQTSDSDSESNYPIATTMSTTSLPHGLVYPAGAYPYIPKTPESKIMPLLLLKYQHIVEDHTAGLYHPPADGKALLKAVKASFNQNMAISCFATSLANSLSNKTFIEFVDLMRKQFLEKDWDTKLCLEIREMKMQNNKCFRDWLQPMLSKNYCLQGIKLHFNNSLLIENVDTNICPVLQDIINEKPDKVKKKDWETYWKCMDGIDKTCHKKMENAKKVNQKELLEQHQELNVL
ncbi:hypothetical protein NP233_g6853 [Leucocoprinus birnbaumii]|uniref:Uncharacterized protein n=1 Tax=Leucocoprinus birnbaumii TaxID=56174 RepID=A0AAD5YV63_9AGAR|nr:hypothetical protein NP233_g6853 [Leucocoprinus birnbaumii]